MNKDIRFSILNKNENWTDINFSTENTHMKYSKKHESKIQIIIIHYRKLRNY